jgi:hypothetical protein
MSSQPAVSNPRGAGTAPTTRRPPRRAPRRPSAAELSAQARERFRAKDYDAAVRLFEQAHAVDPNPNYLFNIGRVYEEKRDLRAAVDYYQRFVMEPRVDIGAREQAVQRLRVLKAILNETEPEPAPASGPAAGTAHGDRTGAHRGPPRARAVGPGRPEQGHAPRRLRAARRRRRGDAVGGVFAGLTLAGAARSTTA